MELRSRSRSKTPFIQKTIEDDDTDQYNGSNKRILTRSRKSTNIINASEHYITSSSSSTMNVKKTRKSYKTSDYSSEDGESDWKHITENQRNQIIEDAKAAANGNTKISALDLYRKAGRYWDKYPKTDWTYSPHSKDRVEIAPGVVQMPNMSRPTIHSYESSTNTDLTFSQYSRYNQEYHQNWLIRCINYIKYLFSSTNTATISSKTTSIDESDFIKRKSITKRSIFSYVSTIFLTIFSIFYYFYYLQNSLIVWFGKQLHHFTSRLMLIDTWLLMKRRNSGSKINRLIVLCFLPLIIFAGWWLLSAIGNTILTYFSNNGNSTSLLMAATTPTTTLSPILEDIEENSMGRKPEFSPPQFTTNINDEIIDKILNNPKISKLINNNIDRDSNQNYRKLLLIIDELKREINRVNRKLIDVEKFHIDDLNRISIEYQTENIKNYARLSAELKRCCYRSNFVNIESYTTRILHDLLNNPEFLLKQHGLNQYFRNLFVTQHELELKLSNLTRNLSNDYNPTIEQTAKTVMDRIVDKIDTTQLTDKKINELIQENLKIFDADKTGLVDYAMESMGGQIITTRCTETYNGGTRVFSIFNIPLWYQPNTPRIVITPSIHPGECWAFQNFPGFLVVKLSNRIRIEAFTIEHVSRLLVPNQRIDSAPKEFEVYGLNDESDPQPVLIGQYVYDYNGDSMQYFIAQQSALVYDMVELRVKSNHGNPNYTCLYRFRVHGTTVVQT